jgi:hypothetical protein
MSMNRSPDHAGEMWEGGFLIDPPREVRSVSARGGLVIAGGEELYLLRPGAERLMNRLPPPDVGAVHVVAAEPRGQRRSAVASAEMIAFFFRTGDDEHVLRLRPPPPFPTATHLVWGGTSGASSLYIRWDDGSVARLSPDLSDIETLDIPSIEALAVDEAGIVAMISMDPEPLVFVSRGEDELLSRPFVADAPEAGGTLHLAVAGRAAAVSLPDGRVLVSRRHDEPFAPCEALAGATALAFEGTGADAALFGAVSAEEIGWIGRVDVEGASTRIAELPVIAGAVAEIVSLAWDASRKTLWGASPQAGLFLGVPKGKKPAS